MPAGQSRRELLEAARAAFERDAEPTMADIASATGLSMRQLYRLFGTREGLLRELELETPPGARERILEAALDLLGASGLAELSMDDLAERATVSRATLYRLFPGKPALFRELIAAYSPWEPIARVLEQCAAAGEVSPEHVMPRVARAMADALSGRTSVLLRMVFEMARGNPDAAEGVQRSMARGMPDLIAYLEAQIAAGALRRVHPVLALQLLAGPIVVHELTLPLAELVGSAPSREEVVDQVVSFWLRAMAPD